MPMKTTTLPTLLSLGAALAMVGCAVAPTSPTVMVLPGTQKSQAQFQADYAACQQQAQAMLSGDAQAANDQAAATVVVGTVIGAAAGALLGQGSYHSDSSVAWGAGTGMLIGSAAAGSSSQASSYSLQQRFNAAFIQCMYLHGNQVPGAAGYRRRAPVAPAPPPANYPPPNYPAPSYPPPNYPAPSYPPPNYPAPN